MIGGSYGEKLESGEPIPGRTNAEQVRGEIGEDVKRRAIDATVRVVSPRGNFSGVLVGDRGIVVTCAHTGQLPGDDLTVVLADSRKVRASALGVNRITDIGLIRLQGQGPWPGTDMGDSYKAAEGQACLIIGYPAQPGGGIPERAIEVVAAVRPRFGYSSWHLFTFLDYQVYGGMSGGGVFDREGRLIAVHSGGGNPRIEAVKAQWDRLIAETQLISAHDGAKLAVDGDVAHRCAHGGGHRHDGKQVAMGTIVDRSGLILTKSSLVGDEVQCRLHDGREFGGKVLRRWMEHDLALAKVDNVTDLVAATRPEPHDYPAGTMYGSAPRRAKD